MEEISQQWIDAAFKTIILVFLKSEFPVFFQNFHEVCYIHYSCNVPYQLTVTVHQMTFVKFNCHLFKSLIHSCGYLRNHNHQCIHVHFTHHCKMVMLSWRKLNDHYLFSFFTQIMTTLHSDDSRDAII